MRNLRDCNIANSLRVNKSPAFEKARTGHFEKSEEGNNQATLDSLDVENVLYALTDKASLEIVHGLIKTLGEHSHITEY